LGEFAFSLPSGILEYFGPKACFLKEFSNNYIYIIKQKNLLSDHNPKQEVCHIVALPSTLKKKKYLKAKEELWKLKYISPCKNIIFKTILFFKKKTQNPSKLQ
jgi:hypothetical protein